MTAEVAIITKSAIAVAADSAVTVGGKKVHRSTTKIFAVGPDIGAMIYGYSEIGGLPWETLLKMFRMEHGSEKFATVKACYDKIRAYLEEDRFRQENGPESLIRFAIEIMEPIGSLIEDLPEAERTAEKLNAIIDEEAEHYTQLEGTIDFNSPSLEDFKTGATDIVQSVAENVFGDIEFTVPPESMPKLAELLYYALNSPYTSDYMSGLVVFGFGADELFPKVYSVAFDAVPLGRIRSVFQHETDVVKNGASIYPLAERDIMDTVVRGVTGHLHEMFVEATGVIATEVAERIIRDNVAPDEQAVSIELARRIVAEVVQNYGAATDGYIEDIYVYGMLETVENMPKEDIALLAEALVEITAMRVKTSDNIESVAGPVDVCVITKGDGLIWTKRKHYFDLAKNLQYLHRRFGTAPAVPLDGGGHESA